MFVKQKCHLIYILRNIENLHALCHILGDFWHHMSCVTFCCAFEFVVSFSAC